MRKYLYFTLDMCSTSQSNYQVRWINTKRSKSTIENNKSYRCAVNFSNNAPKYQQNQIENNRTTQKNEK